jgi:protein TonB
MPAKASLRPRDRLVALVAAAAVQLALGAALLSGFRVDVLTRNELVSRLIEITLPKPPAPKLAPAPVHRTEHRMSAAPKARRQPMGGSPGPAPSHALAAPTPVVAVRPAAPPSGGGSGMGPASGVGAGGGSGGQGYGADDDGGTDLVQIAGEIRPSDYPRDLRERGIGGRVGMVFTVGTNGRVTSCTVTRSSGVPELDALTCRLIQQRFRYRPSTDRLGRPIPDEVEGEHDWIAGRR